MKVAAHTDLLVLGIGEDDVDALNDASASVPGFDWNMADCDPIEDDAARHVQQGGDCRALTMGNDGVIRLAKERGA